MASALAPATAYADAPPLTADFTATDVTSGTNHQWYVTGTTSNTATTIATGGTVTFNYPATRHVRCHNVAFTAAAKPTVLHARAGRDVRLPRRRRRARRGPTTCRFDTPGTYAFVCQVHATMRATVIVAPDSAGATRRRRPSRRRWR